MSIFSQIRVTKCNYLGCLSHNMCCVKREKQDLVPMNNSVSLGDIEISVYVLSLGLLRDGLRC